MYNKTWCSKMAKGPLILRFGKETGYQKDKGTNIAREDAKWSCLYAPASSTRIPPTVLLKPCLHAVPRYTIHKVRTFTPKDVQGASDGEVDLAITRLTDELEILDCPCAARVRDGNGAPLCKACDQFEVNAFLQAFVVGSVN